MSDAVATPSAAKHDRADDHGEDERADLASETACRRARVRGTKSATVWSANTISVETSSAAMYVAAGSGVARSRFRIACSRRTTSVIARPANAVFAQP